MGQKTDRKGMVLPQTCLDKLKCSLCNLYLSYYPILIAKDSSNICGRCSHTNKHHVRNTAYEIAMKLVKFPCSNDKFECMEWLTPSGIPRHEKVCRFRRMECPLKYTKKCNWQGCVTEIQNHYEDLHCEFLMVDLQFEVNFIDSYDECYCLLYGEEVFLFRRKANGETNVLECYVKYIGTHDVEDNFFYQIKLLSRQNHNTKEFEKLPAVSLEQNLTEIRGNAVMTELNMPSIIIGSIEIISNETEATKKKHTSGPGQPKNVNFDMLSELECPVCFLYLTAPVYQCLGGHSICSSCKNNIQECPSCKSPIEDTRNITLEKMIDVLIYPCKYLDNGCSYSTKAALIREHEEYCDFGTIDCPLATYIACDTKSLMCSQILEHFQSEHHEYFTELDVINSQIYKDENGDFEDLNILKYYEKLFVVFFKVEDDVFKFSVQVVGPPELSKNYFCEIDIVDNNCKGRRLFCKDFCSPLCSRSDCLLDNENFYFDVIQIAPFIKKDLLSYIIRITPVNC